VIDERLQIIRPRATMGVTYGVAAGQGDCQWLVSKDQTRSKREETGSENNGWLAFT